MINNKHGPYWSRASGDAAMMFRVRDHPPAMFCARGHPTMISGARGHPLMMFRVRGHPPATINARGRPKVMKIARDGPFKDCLIFNALDGFFKPNGEGIGTI